MYYVNWKFYFFLSSGFGKILIFFQILVSFEIHEICKYRSMLKFEVHILKKLKCWSFYILKCLKTHLLIFYKFINFDVCRIFKTSLIQNLRNYLVFEIPFNILKLRKSLDFAILKILSCKLSPKISLGTKSFSKYVLFVFVQLRNVYNVTHFSR
jgi:hypothetical protein